jgi:phosphoribosylglycinamide formyltransferase-1
VRGAGADLICLAGFMRLLTPALLTPFQGRVLNIHPSLLPAFPGLHAQRQALAGGVRVAGCSVHFVDAGTDTGAIIAQAAVPVLASDTEESLSERILAQEHRIYPAAVGWVSRGSVRLEGGRAVAAAGLWPAGAAAGVLTSPPS